MSCEAWKWLTIVTGVATIGAEEFYSWRVIGFIWPPDPDVAARRHERFKPFLPLWLLCGFLALASLIVYLAHCVD
jgi:hypothetical protein